ncbi:hypothetical protein ACN6KF_006800 [Labrys sp. La1]|uniref:hypothetical protein n=1 Tax=Labrys sp. La1 TaxID=3404917 RepID=UPI003EBAA98C
MSLFRESDLEPAAWTENRQLLLLQSSALHSILRDRDCAACRTGAHFGNLEVQASKFHQSSAFVISLHGGIGVSARNIPVGRNRFDYRRGRSAQYSAEMTKEMLWAISWVFMDDRIDKLQSQRGGNPDMIFLLSGFDLK